MIKIVIILLFTLTFTSKVYSGKNNINSNDILTINISARLNPVSDLFGTFCGSITYLKRLKRHNYVGGNLNANLHSVLATIDYALREHGGNSKYLGGEIRAGIGIGRYHNWIDNSNSQYFPAFSSAVHLEIGPEKFSWRLGAAIDLDITQMKYSELLAFGPSTGFVLRF